MNRDDCQQLQLVNSYLSWLKEGLSAATVGESCELTTPFLDRHNDHLQIYASRDNGKIVLSDDGYILADLEASGLELITPKRKAAVDAILNGFGVRVDDDRLIIEASERNVGQRLHSLVQAMLAVNDMFVLAQPRVVTYFWEDVRTFLDQHNIRYSPRVKLAGRTGYDHGIDFLIPKSAARPERFIQAINAPNKNTIGTYLFSLVDTREARGNNAAAYAFLNDGERKVGGDVMEALEAYTVKPVLWTHREQSIQSLAD